MGEWCFHDPGGWGQRRGRAVKWLGRVGWCSGVGVWAERCGGGVATGRGRWRRRQRGLPAVEDDVREKRCGEEETVEPMWRRGGQGMWDEVGPGGGMGALVDLLSGVVSPRISLLAPALS